MNNSKTIILAGRLLLLAGLFLLPTQTWARRTRTDKIRVKTGIEVLKAQHFRPLQGKRVGLITNPTGVDNTLRSTIDLLYEAPGVQLVALYGPEHGVRGNQHAGESVTDVRDEATGLPIHSLYGKTRKATPEMVRGLDALVYDIQDIGCRSYTYISTMGLAMEVAAEQDLEFIVLDRPNPLGGWRVEGCLTEDDCTSFVSQFPIPYVYGLTCGELARLLNGERMLSGGKACRLTVVPMKGWRRDMTYADTGLQWIPASPHIPQPASAIAYPMSGIIGEFSYLNIGVGYTIPFQMFAAPWIDANRLAARLSALGLEGVVFRPVYAKPFYATMQGEQVQGVQVHFTDYRKAPLTDIQFLVAQEVAALWPEQAMFKVADPGRFRMFDIVCGSEQIRRRFAERHRWEDIRDYWYKDVDAFRRLSKKYYLYK